MLLFGRDAGIFQQNLEIKFLSSENPIGMLTFFNNL